MITIYTDHLNRILCPECATIHCQRILIADDDTPDRCELCGHIAAAPADVAAAETEETAPEPERNPDHLQPVERAALQNWTRHLAATPKPAALQNSLLPEYPGDDGQPSLF